MELIAGFHERRPGARIDIASGIDHHHGKLYYLWKMFRCGRANADMQDEIVSRLANTLNAQLVKAEARRAERSLHPDAMDLYFQGRALGEQGV